MLVSLILFPATFYYLSPAVPMMGAAEGIVSGSLIMFAIFFVTSLFAGRIFCAWLCPGGAMGDIASKFRTKAVSKKIRWTKYIIWLPWITGLVFLFRKNGGVKSIDMTYQTKFGLSVSNVHSLIIYLIVCAIIFISAMAVGKRGGCHTICWMSPFMIIGRKLSVILKIPRLKLIADKESCTSCGRCVRGCPMSLDVKEMVIEDKMESVDCILCGNCADECPAGVIRYSVGIKP